MAEELHRKPKEVFILDCFLENVNTDDLNDNPLQPRKRKFPKKKKKENSKENKDIPALLRRTSKHGSSFSMNID